jgi:hypothetical protein
LNGADGIIFKNLTIQSAFGVVINIQGGSDCNQFINNKLSGVKATSIAIELSIVYALNSNNNITMNNNIFKNNYFEYGSRGMIGANLTGLILEGNVFKDAYQESIIISSSNSIRIADNEILSTDSQGSTSGISLSNILEGFMVSGNKIILPGGSGIGIGDVNGTDDHKGIIMNNFISINGGDFNQGISTGSLYHVQIFNNTVRVNNENGMAVFYGGGIYNSEVKNNIFSNFGGGYVVYVTCCPIISTLTSNYNNYYATGSNFIYYQLGHRANLAQWRAASGGKDANSISVNPFFNSPTDLHVNQLLLNGKATPLAQVTHDIDGDLRDATSPDIGADEFTPTTGPLPVNLTRFEAAPLNRTIRLLWVTDNERNNKGFQLQRSENESTDFKDIGWIDSRNSATGLNEYAFTDKDVIVNRRYNYRLKQIDVDGQFKYSMIRTAMLDETGNLSIRIAPNPADKILQVIFSGDIESGNAALKIIDVRGAIVLTKNLYINPGEKIALNVSNLSGGTYYLVIENRHGIMFNKLFQKH